MAKKMDKQLWQAAIGGDLDAVNAALSQGADVNARGEYGDTALNLAAENGHFEVVERLMEASANIENLGGAEKTPLMNAAFAGHALVVQMLLDKGARISTDLLGSLQMKVNILEENAESGMVNPESVQAWRGFLEGLVKIYQQQNPPDMG